MKRINLFQFLVFFISFFFFSLCFPGHRGVNPQKKLRIKRFQPERKDRKTAQLAAFSPDCVPNKLTCSIIYTYKTRERKVNKNKKATFPSFFFFYTFSTRSDARITLDRASRSRRVRVFNAPNLVGKLRCKRSSCVAGPREFVTFPSGRKKKKKINEPDVANSFSFAHTDTGFHNPKGFFLVSPPPPR